MIKSDKRIMAQFPPYSVVIPAYNAAPTIVRAIESVLNQTIPPAEVLVVDDGSQDNTCEILSQFGDRVQTIRQSNAGPAAARNHGIRTSRSAWVALLDSDDSWLPEKMERQLCECREEVGIVHSYAVDEAKNLVSGPVTFDSIWHHNCIGTSTVVLNKSAWDQVGGFNEARELIGIEDFNLWLRILAKGFKTVLIKEPLIHYTPSAGNLSSRYESVIRAELLNVDLIAELLNLPAKTVREKKLALYQEYGQALFWRRNLSQARHYYAQSLRYQLSLSNLTFWLATFLPSSILNSRRMSH